MATSSTPLKKMTKPLLARRARGRPPNSAYKSLRNKSIVDFSEPIDHTLSTDHDNADVMGEWTAAPINTRTNARKASDKAMHSKRFIDNIIKKYCDSDHENDDNDNIVVNNGKPNNENMRSRSVNDSVDTTIEDVVSRGTPRTTTSHTKAKRMAATVNTASASKLLIDHNYCGPKQNTNAKQLQSNSDHVSNDSVSTVDLPNNDLIVKSRKIWTDKEFQLAYLNITIEMLAKRDSAAIFMKKYLKRLAMKTLGFPTLPSLDNSYPLLKFNCKGEPKFEFYFMCDESPVHITERIEGYDHQLFELTKIVYQMIVNERITNEAIDVSVFTPNSVSVDDARNVGPKRISF